MLAFLCSCAGSAMSVLTCASLKRFNSCCLFIPGEAGRQKMVGGQERVELPVRIYAISNALKYCL